MNDRATRIDLLVLTLAYVLAHALPLANTGLFWDDWEITGAPLAAVSVLFEHAGNPAGAYYHRVLGALGVPAYRLVTFACHLAMGFFLYAIARRMPEVDRRTRLVLALLFVLFPVNAARISTVVSWYSFCTALFFAGFWLLAEHLARRSAAARFAALPLLLVSFLTPSLLVFYGVVLIYLAYQWCTEPKAPRALATLALHHLDLLLLPIAFWTLKLAFFPSHASFRGYNRVTPESAMQALAYLDGAVIGGFIEPLAAAYSIAPPLIAPAAIAVLLVAALLGRIDSPPIPGERRHHAWLLAAGVMFFGLAVFPYLAVGKTPAPDDWDSRHQLLTPLGAALILVSAPRLFLGPRLANLIYASLVIAFIAANVRVWIAYQADWYKQVALVENLATLPEIGRETDVLFDDRTTDLNANRRRYRSYEYAALLRAAQGGGERRARAITEAPAATAGAVIVIEHGALRLTPREILSLRVLESRDGIAFRRRAGEIVRLSVRRPP